jgi:(E)-4-hydroxy-3-methylbut-2-enyl-diphosphate synthase
MGHLKNLKIAVMGCIVNGPGEMADADYGYVGAGQGKVTLYIGKTIVRKNVDEKDALDALEEVIRANGDWME